MNFIDDFSDFVNIRLFDITEKALEELKGNLSEKTLRAYERSCYISGFSDAMKLIAGL